MTEGQRLPWDSKRASKEKTFARQLQHSLNIRPRLQLIHQHLQLARSPRQVLSPSLIRLDFTGAVLGD
eukprot:3560418-Rhodomonas_salina.2